MEAFPPEYLYHVTPPLHISGLGSDAGSVSDKKNPLLVNGELILESKQPVLNSPAAKDLLSRFKAKSRQNTIWEPLAGKASKRQVNHLLHIEFTSRVKEPKLDSDSHIEVNTYKDGSTISILSPRNPQSELYPDGIINIHWLQKYLHLLPALVLVFYELHPESEKDKEITEEIIILKNELAKRNVKLAVVFTTAEDSQESETVISDRIYNLRRVTGLQPRTGLFLLPKNADSKEKEALVESLCQLAYSRALEFYTTLAKDIRKKRGRSHVLSSSQASENLSKLPLSSAGWEARYNFKLGVFAEFRQDLDFSLNCYETAYDSILELFETISPASDDNKLPWTQARLLLDIVAYKIVRLCLYQQQANAAFRKFDIHIGSATGIIEQKGLSRGSYQHVNWLAQQYKLLAHLVSASEDTLIPASSSVAPAPDDHSPGIRLPRSGFLCLEAVELIQGLPKLAKDNDSYMDFTFDYDNEISELLASAVKDFSLNTPQKRMICYTHYQQAETYLNKKDYANALKNYKLAVEIYRQEGWNSLLVPLLDRIKECAEQSANTQDIYESQIEKAVTLHEPLSDIKRVGDEVFDLQDIRVDLFEYGFAFDGAEWFCGVEAAFQLYVKPLAQTDTVKLSSLTIEFEGAPSITLENNDSAESSKFIDVNDINKVPLTFENGVSRVYQFHHHPDHLGDIQLSKIIAVVVTDAFEGTNTLKELAPLYKAQSVPWFSDDNSKFQRRQLLAPSTVKVLPRPSRLAISQDASGSASPGENMTINVKVVNNEGEEVVISLDAKISTADSIDVETQWDVPSSEVHLAPESSSTFPLSVQVPDSVMSAESLTFELVASYSLISEPGTIIRDATSHFIGVTRCFRIDFDVSALAHPDKWPSMFVPDEHISSSPLIHKRWDLGASVLFIGEGKVQIVSTDIEVAADDTAECKLISSSSEKSNESLSHNDRYKADFVLDSCRKGTKELRTINAEARLNVKWRRANGGDGKVNILKSSPVRLTLPLYEPRVIVDMERLNGSAISSGLDSIKLTYYIENATSHILTYAVTMTSSQAFAFQGPKSLSLRLLPYSRRLVEYVLIARETSSPAMLPQFRAHDTYYKRTLVVTPANREIRQDRTDLFISI